MVHGWVLVVFRIVLQGESEGELESMLNVVSAYARRWKLGLTKVNVVY